MTNTTKESAKRKAIYIPYAQAVPQKYAIDKDNCIYFREGQVPGLREVLSRRGRQLRRQGRDASPSRWASVVLAPGFAPFDPTGIRTWGYGLFPNVITSMELERLLSASGPTEGHLVRPSDGKEVRQNRLPPVRGHRETSTRRPTATVRRSAAPTPSRRP